MKRASSVTSLAAKCLGITLAMVGGVTLAVSQNQPQKPSYTLAEFNALRLVSAETNPQVRIRLLDDFTAKFPYSVLMAFIYQDYSVTSFGLKNYPEAVIYADKLLALGDAPGEELFGEATEKPFLCRLICLGRKVVSGNAHSSYKQRAI